MRVVRNIGYIKRRQRAGRVIVFSGVWLLIGSWVLSFTTTLFLVAMLGLAFGFIFFNGGLQQLTRWSRKPRADEVLDQELRPLNDRFTLVHFPELPGRRPDHVLIMPSGLLVMTTREIQGRLSVKGRTWRKRGNPLGKLFFLGGPQLGNPTIENEEQVRALREFLTNENLPGQVEGAVVFVADLVEVDIVEPEIPVLHASEVLDHVRQTSAEPTLTGRDREQLVAQLSRGEAIERDDVQPARPRKRVRAA